MDPRSTLLSKAVGECWQAASSPTAASLRAACEHTSRSSPWVHVEVDAGYHLLPLLREARAHAWHGVFEQNSSTPADLLFDACVNASLNGGYFHRVGNGPVVKWERAGSGSRALSHWLEHLRDNRLLPVPRSGVDDSWLLSVAVTMDEQPYQEHRLAAMAQLADPARRSRLDGLLAGMVDGMTIRVRLRDVDILASVYPTAMGEDPLRKKAHLALIFLVSQLHQNGWKVEWDALFPADYQLPRGLEKEGILRLHPALANLLGEGELLPPSCVAVAHIRAATVHAVMELSDRADIPAWLADGALFTSWRSEPDFEHSAPPPMRIDGTWF